MTPFLETDLAPSHYLVFVNQAEDPYRDRFIDKLVQTTLETREQLHRLYLQPASQEPYIQGQSLSASVFVRELPPEWTADPSAMDEGVPTTAPLPSTIKLAKTAALSLVMLSMAAVALGFLGHLWLR